MEEAAGHRAEQEADTWLVLMTRRLESRHLGPGRGPQRLTEEQRLRPDGVTRGGRVQAGVAGGSVCALASRREKRARFCGKLGSTGPALPALNSLPSSLRMQTSNTGSRLHLIFNPD